MRMPQADIGSRVESLLYFLAQFHGADNLVLRARKLEAVGLIESADLGERILGLQRLIYEDPTLARPPHPEVWDQVLDGLMDEVADLVARRSVEQRLEEKIARKVKEGYLDYLRDLRLEVLRGEQVETSTTMERLARLDMLEERGLEAKALTVLRPTDLSQVVGQREAIEALLTRLGTPYPQHVILYGPPGVGKTTVARLVLERVKAMEGTPFQPDAPFVEVDATTLRWDPREITNPLLGSVHDPIYQGSRRDLADAGIPEPKLGLVTDAHGGVLFIDEIGELDPLLQSKLLKVLEDRRVYFESSYYDDADPRVPQYIRKLFREGAPADFILIGATTRSPEEISPAIRSRCSEVYFRPLSAREVEQIVTDAARRLKVTLEEGVAAAIARYTAEGRKAVQILTDAYGRACQRRGRRRGRPRLRLEDVMAAVRSARLRLAAPVLVTAEPEVGRTWALGVSGFVGTCLEIEAACFPARTPGQGRLRFNEAAGEMARDSVFNAASVIRRLLGKDLGDYDVHVNVVGGGRVDGPSAGLPVVLAIVSALEERPLRPDLAATGEVSIRGRVKPVAGVVEKIHGALRAGIRRVLVPADGHLVYPDFGEEIEVVPVSTVAEALEYAWESPAGSP